jgi:amidase/aspartyl-tRNA(Asn)/glutamyl-tRNA(Gln) amidotransferase subunit A
MRSVEPLYYWSATAATAAIRRRELTPLQVFNAIRERIGALNSRVNAYCTLDFDGAQKAAEEATAAVERNEELGPLHGVPVAVKDDLAVKGLRYTAGSWLPGNHVAEEDDLTVKRLRRAGAIIVGKTNLPEFGHKATTDNIRFGTTNNPWSLAYTAGGSSGGSAAAVAAGMAYLALGTDIGGSIRIPASCCGIVGHKPSLGRIPRVPAGNFFNTAWVSGPMARTVEDVCLAMRVLSGPDAGDPFSLPPPSEDEFSRSGDLRGLRIAWNANPTGSPVDPVVVAAARAALGRLEPLGVQLPDVELALRVPRRDIADLLAGDCWSVFAALGLDSPWMFAAQQLLGLVLEQWRLSPSFAAIARRSFFTSLRRYIAAQMKITDFVEKRVAPIFEEYDLLASPTIALPPFPHPDPRQLGPRRVAGTPVDPHFGWLFTWPFNFTGQPAVSLPCGYTMDGLPLGLQIVGRRGADGLVLRVAGGGGAPPPPPPQAATARARTETIDPTRRDLISAPQCSDKCGQA